MHIQERYPHLMSVYGWLSDGDAQATEDLLTYQRSRGLEGDVLEIGVYLGKYFILLGKLLSPDETILGLDIFGSRPPTIPGSANTSREECLGNLRRHLPELWNSAHLVVMEEDSADFASSDYAQSVTGTFRFISIDGSHDTATVLSDLKLSDRMLVPGGLVALDDWNADIPVQHPGVREGWALYDAWADTRRREERLRVVWALDNKLLLTNDDVWANDYRAVLKDRALVVG